MTRAKELLEQATPLPYSSEPLVNAIAVSLHLQPYEAAVEALERLILTVEGHADVEPTETDGVPMEQARAALRRLRDEVPA